MAHNNYYLDLCAETFIVFENKVLLRLHEKYAIWGGPGGHIDAGEDANEAVVREAFEETGLEITLIGPKGWEKKDTENNLDLVPPIYVNRHRINPTHEHSAFIFAATTASDKIDPQEEASKNVEHLWCSREELDELQKIDSRLRPEVYRYACTALDLTIR